MKMAVFVGFLVLVAYLSTLSSAAEIRGEIAEVVDGEVYTWTPENFAGFYYDSGSGIGTESLTMTITGNALEEDSGVVYRTKAEADVLNFEDWGRYYVMGFMSRKYFVGYSNGLLYNESGKDNLLSGERLSAVLVDFDGEVNVGSGATLDLGQGYRLAINSIDLEGDKVFVQLYKDGSRVDSGVVSPSEDVGPESTYVYKRYLGGVEDVVVIAAHFKTAFQGGEQDFATIDGVWQIADATLRVAEGSEYERMTIDEVDPQGPSVTMTNRGRKIVLTRDRDIVLMDGIGVRTADQKDISPENPLRFYIYRR